MKKVFLVIAILLLALVFITVLLPSCSSSTTQVTELKFSYWPPPADKWVQRGILPWGDEIEKATNGKIKINFFGGATLGAPPDHLDLVKNGTADIGWINPAFTPSVFPLTDIRNLPFLYPNVQVANKVFWRQQEYLNPLEYKDVKVLWTFATPVMELSTTKKPIRTLEDLKGLKFGETEPMAARVDSFMGIVPQVMQETEIYTALGNGMLDGRWQEYNGLVTWKCGEVTKYRVDNVRIFVHQNMIIMNLQTYNKLPADVRKAIDDTTGFKRSSSSGDVWAQCEQDSRAEILAQDKAKGNPEPYVLNESERTRWIAAAQPAIDDWLKEMDGKGLGQKARELLEKTKQWVAEYSK
jgi:TRAP-type C4-dicarboxylate transport system substrate-binding protein